MSCKIIQENLQDLLDIFAKKSYEAGSCEPGTIEHDVTKKCEELLKLDYSFITLDNQNGLLSPYYPSRIFIPKHEIHSNAGINNYCFNDSATISGTLIQQQQCQSQRHQHQQKIAHDDLYDNGKLKELITMAKYARCRQRFAIPVLLFKGKFICRSATISVMPEAYGRKVVDYAYDCINGINNTNNHISSDDDEHDAIEDSLVPNAESLPFSYHEVIKSDKQLLKLMNVSTILDLMVEQRKMKYFMPVSSSEKADIENQYENFNLLVLPYPGCEFFSKFRDNNYMAKNLNYNWKQSFIDATLNIPKNLLPVNNDFDDINWCDYKKWDIVLITQNYLKAILKYVQSDNYSGLLIHCISGWDRTPLFVSLIRLSLWADGLIHQSLNPIQMAYFTLAYDWYLFGHQLPDRLTRGEEILFFCFHILKHITDDEFSVIDQRKRSKTSSSSGSSSVVVLKSDCCDDEPSSSREDCLLIQNIDQDSNDSFSNCDMSSNENFCVTSRSPNPKRSKTSPISVPGMDAYRQRHESTSSNGSWQVVTETGSIDSIMNGSYMRLMQQDSMSNGGAATFKENITKTSSTLRKQRLNAVRAIFIQSYGKTIGLKFKEGSSMNLVTFIGTIADQLF